MLFLIIEMAGRRFELEAPSIVYNKAQPGSITSPLLHAENERQEEVLNSRVNNMGHTKLSVCLCVSE
jgi:hypothetical protein